MPLLEIRNLSKSFGGLKAVDEFSTEVERGEIFGLIGPNGAGKSTVLSLVSGFLAPTSGSVVLDGADITRDAPSRRAKRGVARMFQQDVMFESLTVRKSVQVGAHMHFRGGSLPAMFGLASARARHRAAFAIVEDALAVVGLTDDSEAIVTALPHGKRRLLALAVALATQPRLLLLDEPLTGMNAEETAAMLSVITSLRADRGMTLVLVEHNMRAVMALCDRICVISFGRRIAIGPPAQVASEESVISAYLGTGADDDLIQVGGARAEDI